MTNSVSEVKLDKWTLIQLLKRNLIKGTEENVINIIDAKAFKTNRVVNLASVVSG